LHTAVPSLVASCCMELSSFVDILRNAMAPAKRTQFVEPVSVAIDALHILLPSGISPTSCTPQDAYRYRTEQHKLCFESDMCIVSCIGELAGLCSSTSSDSMQQAVSHLMSSEPVISIVKHHIVCNSDCLSQIKVGQAAQGASGECLKSLFNSLLDPLGRWCKYLLTVSMDSRAY
jgi:mediator of RNA polymerase II transcription subunit 12